MNKCSRCGSMAINPHTHGREQNIDMDLCDVCYWRARAEAYKSALNAIYFLADSDALLVDQVKNLINEASK